MGRTIRIALALVAAAFAACAETYNKVEYSTSGDIVPGEWTSQFTKAKNYAESKNLPLVVVWANPGCGFCANFEQVAMSSARTKQWMAARKCVFVFALGKTTADGKAAYNYTLTTAYPMCRVYWRKNAAGKKVDAKFVGRSANLPAPATGPTSLDVRFINYVDSLLGTTDVPTEDAKLDCALLAEYEKGVAIESVAVGVTGAELKRATVTGLPTGLTYSASKGVITGKPSRSGTFTTKVSVTTTGGTELSQTFTIVVKTPAEHAVTAPCEAAAGSVSGQGTYAKGTKVTLRVTVKSAYEFVGWYDGETLLSTATSYSFTMGDGDVTVTPRFQSKADAEAALALSFDGASVDAAAPLERTAMCGVPVAWAVLPSGIAGSKVSFSGLPSGLRYNASSGTVEGTPTTAKRYAVKARVTTSSGRVVKQLGIVVTVEALPLWARGTFVGCCTYHGVDGRAQLSVTSAGKVSGKLVSAGTSHSFSAASLQSYANGRFAFAVYIPYSYREGVTLVRDTKRLALVLAADGDLGGVTGGDSDGLALDLLQNVWERKDLKAPTFVSGSKAPVVELDSGIKLKVGSKGAVQVGGKYGKRSVSGTSQLVAWCANGALTSDAATVISLSGSAFEGGYYGEELDLRIGDANGDGKLDTVTER